MPISLRAQHSAQLTAMDHFEGGLHWQMVRDKNVFIRACAARYREHGTVNFFDLTDKHQARVFATLKSTYRRIIPAFGALAIAHVQPRKMKDEDGLFSDLADQWVHTEGLKRSHLIADTTEADVLAAISDGMDQGLGTSDIASSISDLTDLSPWRSDLIARTEVHAAANFASVGTVRAAQDNLGIRMLKAWSPTIDSRTRPAHADMEGSDPIPLDEQFEVDGEMLDRPGDPAGSPDNVINCRCVLVYQEDKGQ